MRISQQLSQEQSINGESEEIVVYMERGNFLKYDGKVGKEDEGELYSEDSECDPVIEEDIVGRQLQLLIFIHM